MKTIKRVPVTFEKCESVPETKDMKEAVIYISDIYKTASHRCLCGCGSLTVTPLFKGEWSYWLDEKERLNMSPSIGNYSFDCKSHYIIGKGVANFV